MANALKDALFVSCAAHDLDLFTEFDPQQLELLMEALRDIDVESCSDFRFAFVTSDKVDASAVKEFAKGDLSVFGEIITLLAEDLIPEGPDCLTITGAPTLRKRSCPTHVVGGRLVFQRLEDFERERRESQGPSSSYKGPVLPAASSKAALKLRETAVKSQANLREKLAKGHSEDFEARLLGKPTSLHDRASAQREKAIAAGHLVLREVGWASKRYTELFNADGNLVADEGIVGAFNDIIISGLEPQVVQGYCAESFRFLAWLTALQRPVQEVTELQIAGYIRNCLGRGKSVPGRVRLALVWLQRLIDCPLGAGKEDLVMMVRSLSSGTQSEKTPVAARMIPVEIVRLLERGCFNATTDLLRVFCGLGCLLAFGIKRWSDAQRFQSLDLAVDSLVVRSWKSKKKKSSITWGALRSGFEKCD